ncbi:hypothetical protein [Desulfobulbus alkaliphilus]|uniref:hypothetical protein n=1 Tax=Desulfobulbus alkaliphilus TaxID=869814 RepID=UPI001963B1A0|nr:hypothetical protein [Desulfobulbus alkaliphilus]MBM9536675.1 hypothetical protein [Desulfobulbus alkaliphilus]
MSKASQIIVLCEDKAHELFVRRFLKKGWGVKPRAIRVPPYPNGKGSGKKHVEDNISLEAEALRRQQASTILLVIQDADEISVGQVKTNLDAKLQNPRDDKEPIAYIIPKWHIQTWIAYLDGEKVDESDKDAYARKYRAISESKEAHPFIDKLADDCRGNRELESPPDSLVTACEEFERIRSAL